MDIVLAYSEKFAVLLFWTRPLANIISPAAAAIDDCFNGAVLDDNLGETRVEFWPPR